MIKLYQVLATACLMLIGTSAGIQAAEVYEVPRDGVALLLKPSDGAKVVDHARKGWKLHACAGKEAGDWVEICEIDSGDGPWYVYRMYGLPGENVFVRMADIESAPAPRLISRPAAGETSALVPVDKFRKHVDAFTAGLVHLKATGSNVRLRKGPGASHELAGTVNGGWDSELIALREPVSGEGRKWYHVLYRLEQQEETGYLPEDAWICADFVKASGLTSLDKMKIENERFRVLSIAAKDLPAFSFNEPLSLSLDTGETKGVVTVPAGTLMTLFTIPFTLSDSGNQRFANLWEPIDDTRIRLLGYLPLDELEARSGYEGEQSVRKWIAKYTSSR